jgi:hypothetical protein
VDRLIGLYWNLMSADKPTLSPKKLVSRPELSATEIEAPIMSLIRKSGGRPRLSGIALVYVGSLGTKPNWFARPILAKVSPKDMKLFVTALAQVRKEYDLAAGREV